MIWVYSIYEGILKILNILDIFRIHAVKYKVYNIDSISYSPRSFHIKVLHGVNAKRQKYMKMFARHQELGEIQK